MNRKIDWLREAEAEIRAAADLARCGHASWSCFTAQQAGEKALKAIALHLGRKVPTHDLVDLLKVLSPLLALPPDVVKAANTLNRYYSPTRYPDAFASGAPFEKYLEIDAQEAVRLAEFIYQFARATVAP